MRPKVPNGLNEIIKTFGDPSKYLDSTGKPTEYWLSSNLAYGIFPAPIALDWDHTKYASKFRCHKLLVETFEDLFTDIYEEGLWDKMIDWDGCYVHRKKRVNGELSTHAWGIAFDIDPSGNPMGSKGIIDPRIIKIIKDYGLTWGGDWEYPDPMHFAYVTNY